MIYQSAIHAALARFNMSAESLARIIGISPAKLSRFMTTNVTMPELPDLMKIIADLDALVADAHPYILELNNIEAVRKMLQRKRDGLRFIILPIGDQEALANFDAETGTEISAE